MTEQPNDTRHFCPGCGAPQRHFARYPWYFCSSCLETATDAEGKVLVFGNASVSGGLSWGYRDRPGERDSRALEVVCLIGGRPVLVHEARFGGVVAEPIPDRPLLDDKHVVILNRTHRLEDARARLEPVG
ncbi:hypothetical protein CSC94_00860 [Zhengella mangrovi]|uniref:ADP-ribosylglycohydrolase n=1 Tax=Zhengella mangrovi TaxID=1982044 RepID=A0A2G1QSR9_9HYPH|nr:hypothetical protein [Zhengella mangrovi]PHP68587.1 hypothetical protein CSC94_00860 [Zhengella mangrovi]